MGYGLGYKQRQVLELASKKSRVSPTGKIVKICGNKSDAKRVLKTLESRGFLEFEGYGYWSISEKGREEASKIEA